jgi:HlyD family secretion protein
MTAPERKQRKRKQQGGLLVAALAVAGIAMVAYGARSGGWFRPEETAALEGVEVRRGPLRISEVVRGNLEARNSISLRSEIDRETLVLFLAPQGPIQKGDLVAELDVAELVERRVVQEIDLKRAEAEAVKANEQYEIQEIQNETDIAASELALQFAKDDLEKYLAEEGEWTHELEQAKEAIVLAEEELAQAENQLMWTQRLAEKGFAQGNDLERDELAAQRRRIELKRAQRELALMQEYGHRRAVAEFTAAIETAERDVRKTEKQAIARLADYESAREATKFQLAREQEKLDTLDEQIQKSKVHAPETGILVHASQRRGRSFGRGDVMEEGATVRRGQEIATIPRSGEMLARASLHETKLEKVRDGQRCLVQVDALPAWTFEGRVLSVALLPESGGWMTDPNQRLYPADIRIVDADAAMRPGMSCSIEILVDDLEDALYVPRQCVFLDGDRTISFRRARDGRLEMREVEVGLDNNKWVQILSGLDEGDVVTLSPPPDFQPRKSSLDQGGGDLPGWDPAAEDATVPEPQAEDASSASGGPEAVRERFQNMSEEERAEAMRELQRRRGDGEGGDERRGDRERGDGEDGRRRRSDEGGDGE